MFIVNFINPYFRVPNSLENHCTDNDIKIVKTKVRILVERCALISTTKCVALCWLTTSKSMKGHSY